MKPDRFASIRVLIFNPIAHSLFLAFAAAAAQAADAQPDEVVVIANRTEQRLMDTAASISVIDARHIHDAQPEQNLSEPLQRTPGIFAISRQNFAQDLLISSRGFGANSTFGARGIKLIVDGIPGTAADGQGQISHIDLPSAERLEVMRGPFSVLYGNSAGGVISVFTESGKPGTQLAPYLSTGSFGQLKYGLKVGGEQKALNYLLDAGKLHTDGYRDHSRTDRFNDNVKLGVQLGADATLGIVANRVSLNALDPLGLTAAQLQSDRSAAGTGALSFNTRKSVDQDQVGATLKLKTGAGDAIVFTPYYGNRHTIQYLASSVNGVVNLHREFYGMNSQWSHRSSLRSMPLQVTAGIDSNQNQDHRETSTNANGVAQPSANGQDYDMSARNLDFFGQAELRPSDQLALTAGVRRSSTTLSATSNNKLPSLGSHDYRATVGMLSAQYYVRDDANVYLSYGSGFDTPTLNQIIYSPNFVNFGGANAGNIGLLAARTRQWELGFKSDGAGGRLRAALFNADTRDDIVIASSNGGKTAYRNAPNTRRRGLELSGEWQLPWQMHASLAYTLVDAKVVDAYTEQITNTAGVTSSATVAAGNRIPGVPKQMLFAEISWQKADHALEFALEGRAAASIAANDLNGAYASGYAIANLRALARQNAAGWSISEFARIENLLDRAYVGSVIVNQAASQFYESAPGRNWLVGVKAVYAF